MTRRHLPTMPVLALFLAACSGGAGAVDAPFDDDTERGKTVLDDAANLPDPRVETERVELTQSENAPEPSPEPFSDPDDEGDVPGDLDAPVDDLDAPPTDFDPPAQDDPADPPEDAPDDPETVDVEPVETPELTAEGGTCTDDGACLSEYCAPLFTGGSMTTLGQCRPVPGAGEFWHNCEWVNGWCA